MKTLFMHESDDDARWRSFKKALVLSLAIHVVALIGLSFYNRQEKHSISLAPINMVELAEPGQTLNRKPARAARKPPPPPEPAPSVEKAAPKVIPKATAKPVAPALPPRIAKKVEDSPPVQPASKVAAKPKPPAPEMTEEELRERMKKLKAKVADKMEGLGENRRTEADVRASIEAMQKRHTAAPAVPAPAPGLAQAREEAGPVVRGAGVQKGTIVDMRFTAYRTKLWEHVKAGWSLLPSLAGRGLTAVIVADVTRNGVVKNAYVETSSGVDAFDQSALRAVISASPLPAIPADIPDTVFADGLGFRFTE